MDWYPWYPEIYASDTMHLTAEQDGIYRRLIDHYMKTRQPLPDNDNALARIAGVDHAIWSNASGIVRAYFTHSDGIIRHPFCDNQLDLQDKKAKKRSHSAETAAKKRWAKQRDKCDSHAGVMPHNATEQNRTGEDNKKKEQEDLNIFEEEGVPFNVHWEFTEQDWKEALAGCNGWDIQVLITKFNNWVQGKSENPRFPGKAFLGWQKSFTTKHKPN